MNPYVKKALMAISVLTAVLVLGTLLNWFFYTRPAAEAAARKAEIAEAVNAAFDKRIPVFADQSVTNTREIFSIFIAFAKANGWKLEKVLEGVDTDTFKFVRDVPAPPVPESAESGDSDNPAPAPKPRVKW